MSIPVALVVPGVLLSIGAVFDLKTREIPDVFPVLLLLWAVASRLLAFQEARWVDMAIGLALGLAVALVAFRLGALGGGDGKLLAALGAAMGVKVFVVVLFWIAVVGGMLALVARLRRLRTVVYGPAIAIGYVFAILHLVHVARGLGA